MKKSDHKLIERTLFMSGGVNLGLGILKIIVGHFSYSKALFVDGVHSLSDVFTDVFVFFMNKISHGDPDEEHPYGHQRFETLGTVLIGVVLLFVAAALIQDNVSMLLSDDHLTQIPGQVTLYVTAISILSKEIIYRYMSFIGNKLNSKLLIANAWHSRSDAISSIVVFVGLIFSVNGVQNVDLFVAVIVALFIGKIGLSFLWDGIKEFVDTGISNDHIKEIEQTIQNVDGVISLHNLRSRKMGSKILLDVNIEVSDQISVTEGHQIASWTAKLVTEKYPEVMDITVHVDTEDDRSGEGYIHDHSKTLLPLRKNLLNDLTLSHLEESEDISKLMLNYFGHVIVVEIHLKNEKNLPEIQKQITEIKEKSPYRIEFKILILV